jgi:hypothetical protein
MQFTSGPWLVAQTYEFHIAHQLLAPVHQHLSCNVQIVMHVSLHVSLKCIEIFLSLRHRSSMHFGSGPLFVAHTHEFHIAHQLLALVHRYLPCFAMTK